MDSYMYYPVIKKEDYGDTVEQKVLRQISDVPLCVVIGMCLCANTEIILWGSFVGS